VDGFYKKFMFVWIKLAMRWRAVMKYSGKVGVVAGKRIF